MCFVLGYFFPTIGLRITQTNVTIHDHIMWGNRSRRQTPVALTVTRVPVQVQFRGSKGACVSVCERLCVCVSVCMCACVFSVCVCVPSTVILYRWWPSHAAEVFGDDLVNLDLLNVARQGRCSDCLL